VTNSNKPAVALIAVPGRWRQTIELAAEIERRGFQGIYSPSLGDAMGLCQGLAHTSDRIRFGTSIVNIYTRHAADYAQSAALIEEISGGRFVFGVGVSHDAMNAPLGLHTGKPLTDMRAFVAQLRRAGKRVKLPPVVLATLRDPMIRLAAQIADGLVFANASLSRTPASLLVLPEDKRGDENFFIGNMIPVCISEDTEAAAARNRKTMIFYLTLPNYREYWKAAGYVEEMEAVEAALEAGDKERLPALMSDRWLADSTLYGSASHVREGVERWIAAGVRTPILVPSSASGNQFKAFEELFAAYA
jgi:alkanesulfonate monooxygenase SsuD/methylene tetrahydromethanopterin reductase-like flavin-dependent oxidoreductase (luciferase family)